MPMETEEERTETKIRESREASRLGACGMAIVVRSSPIKTESSLTGISCAQAHANGAPK